MLSMQSRLFDSLMEAMLINENRDRLKFISDSNIPNMDKDDKNNHYQRILSNTHTEESLQKEIERSANELRRFGA